MPSLRPHKKTYLLGLIILLIIISGSVYAIASGKKHDDKSNSSNQAAPSSQNTDNKSGAPGAANVDKSAPEDKSAATPELDKQLPAGTISPTTVATNTTKYLGQTIQVRGLVVDTGNGNYELVDENASQKSYSLKLSSDTDLKPYSNSTSSSKGALHFHDPVTVVGTLAEPAKGKPVTLVVQSVE